MIEYTAEEREELDKPNPIYNQDYLNELRKRFADFDERRLAGLTAVAITLAEQADMNLEQLLDTTHMCHGQQVGIKKAKTLMIEAIGLLEEAQNFWE